MNILRFMIPKSSVEYINSSSTERQALEKMRYHHYAAIPVLDDEGYYLGTLRSDDIFKYFLKNGRFDYKSAERDGIMSIMDVEYSKPLYHSASVNDLIERVKEHNFVPIVDDRGCFIGIILRRDVLDFLFKCYDQTRKNSENNA